MRSANEELWKICFGDSDAFVKLYFDRCATDANTMAIWQDGRLAAALQMLPYSMTFPAETVPASYVSGACTHPDFRNRGLMRSLLAQTHRRMFADGAWFSLLIPAEPWLWDYYAKSGYAAAFWHTSLQIPCPTVHDAGLRISRYEPSRWQQVATFFESSMQKRPYCIQHTPENLQTVIMDLQLSGGDVWIAEREQTEGLLFALPQDDVLRVTESLFTDEIVENCLLAIAGRFYGKVKVSAEKPVVGTGMGQPLGMARVLRPYEMLAWYAKNHPGLSAAYALHDNDLPQNSATYIISGGVCKIVHEAVAGAEAVDASELSRLLFDGMDAYMGLMLN